MDGSSAQTGIGRRRGKANLKSKVVFWFGLAAFEMPVLYESSSTQPGEESAVVSRALARKV